MYGQDFVQEWQKFRITASNLVFPSSCIMDDIYAKKFFFVFLSRDSWIVSTVDQYRANQTGMWPWARARDSGLSAV